MGYKLKEKTIKEEVEQNLINKFNSLGLSISLDIDEDIKDEDEEDEKKEESSSE